MNVDCMTAWGDVPSRLAGLFKPAAIDGAFTIVFWTYEVLISMRATATIVVVSFVCLMHVAKTATIENDHYGTMVQEILPDGDTLDVVKESQPLERVERTRYHRRELAEIQPIQNDYLHPKMREMVCSGLTSNETCITNGTELRNALEGPCHEQQICAESKVYLLIPTTYNVLVEKEIVIREGLTVHLRSHRGEATISGKNKTNRIFRVSGTLYATDINFADGQGAIHIDGGISKVYLNHCTFINSDDTSTKGTVILNEGELHMYDCHFSPHHQAPIDNAGILKVEPNYEIDYDVIDYISRL